MPAPYRHVVSRPGASGAWDSTEFSGWLQPADQEARMALDTRFTTEPVAEPTLTEIVEQVPYTPAPPADSYPFDLREFASAEMARFAGVPAAGTTAVFTHTTWVMVGSPAPGDPGPFSYVHTYSVRSGGAAVSPHANPSDLLWHPEWAPGWPPGAIGYEVELAQIGETWLAVADPTTLELDVAVQTATGVGTNGGSVTGLVARIAASKAWGIGSLVFDQSSGVADVYVDGTKPASVSAADHFGAVNHPVIKSGVEAEPTVYHFTVDDFSDAPAHSGLFALNYALMNRPDDDEFVEPLVGANGTVQSSPGVTYQGTYTIRPPRIRWIYGTPQIAAPPAYRRTYPRDDGLAGGSAPRTWPPLKAAQSSNRTFGGYP